jgi:carboxyl-terminal processing protease
VLTDDATGGAAEIFAAALHDRAQAVTVGETTVGMAIVQRAVTTESGGTLYMTVARYVSPSGTPLAGRGLSPDDRVVVFADQSAGGKSPAGDPILDRGLEVARGAVPRRRAA